MRFISSENLRSFLLSLFVFVLFACGGGSCGGCEECGVAPIPGGYPIADRIENSAQVRLTSSGVEFIEDNLDPIIAGFLPDGLTFNVPRTTQSFAGIDFTICSSNDCYVQGTIESLDLTPTAPNRLEGHLRLILDSRNGAGARQAWPGTCDIDLDTRRGSRPYVGLVADIDFVAETQPARAGYTVVDVASVGLASGEDIQSDDVRISGGFLGSCALLDFDFIKDLIIGELTDQVDSLLQDAIDEQLCTTQGEYGCPTGTVADGSGPDAVCRYTAGGECVPTLLGTDGQGDLGQAFLGGVSPGTHAPGQFLLASGGEGEAVNGGMSLFFYGGYRSTDLTFTTSPAHNTCVPVIDPPPLPTIPRADTFRGNTIPGTGGSAHVGIGLSESFLNHAGYGMFDSGLLCIGAGTRLSQQLSTGLLSALITSLRSLVFPEGASPVAIALRPQLPPTFEVGAGTAEDALLTITLPSVEIDFYVWSEERYIRFMTYGADLAIPINLSVVDGEIAPEIVAVMATGSVVTNSQLLTEDPAVLAGLIETIISEFASMLTGGIDPFALPDLMGLALEVPAGGVTGVEDAGEEFVGIFANLAVAGSGAPYSATVETRASIAPLTIDPAVLALETWGEGESPWLEVVADAEGPMGVEYEYSFRVNGKPWSPWTTERVQRVQDSAFMLQARHELEVRARVVDEPLSVDPTPAYFEVLVDVLAPHVNVERSGRGVHIAATDVLTAAEDLVLRYRIDDGAWTEWQALPAEAFVPLPYDDAQVEVEVRDEAGNVGAARAGLIRGLPNSTADSGCGCSTFESRTTPFGGFALLMVFGAFLLRRRSQRRPLAKKVGARLGTLAKLASLIIVLGVVGCDCGGGDDPDGGMPDGMVNDCTTCAAAVPPATAGSICCEMTDMCVAYDLTEFCDPGFVCASGDAVVIDAACGLTCSDCVRAPALDPGLLATHLDMDVGDDGSAVLSGYSPGDAPARRYGDLVIGTLPAGGDTVTWEIVDGAPSEPITNDPDGYRGGVSAPGPDVGRWTSIAESGGTYFVSYYDKDMGALKLATGAPGSWSVSVVDDTGDSGRYSSIAMDAAGNPNIAYLQIVRGDAGDVVSRVRVAVADSPTPAGPPDWVSTEIAATNMPCRPAFCNAGETCTESGQCATDTGDCPSACEGTDICLAGGCEATLADSYVEDMPPALGLYNSLVATADGLALVFYDRTTGNLWGADNDGSWNAPFLIDGYGTSTLGVGDSGLAASLFVDAAGVWHVSYVDGAEENLRYARIEGGTVTAETVDDGSTDGTAPNPDGRHIVGDDSSIVVSEGGEIRIAYQDATVQRAMIARRPVSGGAWTLSIFDAEDSTGYWIEQALLGSTSVIATYYRTAGEGGVRVFNVD